MTNQAPYRPTSRPALVLRLMRRHGLPEPQARLVASLVGTGGVNG